MGRRRYGSRTSCRRLRAVPPAENPLPTIHRWFEGHARVRLAIRHLSEHRSTGSPRVRCSRTGAPTRQVGLTGPAPPRRTAQAGALRRGLSVRAGSQAAFRFCDRLSESAHHVLRSCRWSRADAARRTDLQGKARSPDHILDCAANRTTTRTNAESRQQRRPVAPSRAASRERSSGYPRLHPPISVEWQGPIRRDRLKSRCR